MQNKATFIQKKCLAGIILKEREAPEYGPRDGSTVADIKSIQSTKKGPSAGGSEVVGGLRPSSNQLFIKSSPVSTSSSISFSTKKKRKG
jgi:hypothetical protein